MMMRTLWSSRLLKTTKNCQKQQCIFTICEEGCYPMEEYKKYPFFANSGQFSNSLDKALSRIREMKSLQEQITGPNPHEEEEWTKPTQWKNRTHGNLLSLSWKCVSKRQKNAKTASYYLSTENHLLMRLIGAQIREPLQDLAHNAKRTDSSTLSEDLLD